ncbi:MAG TPA: hypothetical protein VK747_04385 [Blastocatellia bacterium]|nr:hypothetical protein [Blastocatellia bacterium]
MNINLHIERLIMDGLPVEARHTPLVQEAVEAELTRLLTDSGLSSGLQTVGVFPRLQADAIQLGGEKMPAQLGQQIAQSVYGSIGNDMVKR